MELREALTQISAIRRQMARTEVFRGYRSVPVALSGLLAILAAVVQPWLAPEPLRQPVVYVLWWASVAIVSMAAAGLEIAIRHRRTDSQLERSLTWLAIEQFTPSIAAGALIAVAVVVYAPEHLAVLPGIWQIVFSLGIFASHRLLPRSTFVVAAFYLLSGFVVLVFARNEHALSPWAMGLPFGCGQLLAAGVLYWSLERQHAESQESEI